MLLVLYLFASFVQQFEGTLQDNVIAKCCSKNFEVQEKNYTLNCAERTNSRIQIRSNFYNFLEKNSDGQCLDSNGSGYFVYNINSSVLVSKKPALVSPFPKCCPLNHLYNNITRSCVKTESFMEDLVEGQFVKIGLPHCRMIVDKSFRNYIDATSWVKDIEPGTFCLDGDINDEVVVRQCQEGLYLCEHKRCFKKCCPDGKSYVGGANCQDTYIHGLNLESQRFSPYIEDVHDDYELIYGTGCSMVSLMTVNKFQYSIKKRGEFSFYHNLSGKFVEHHYSNFKSYCLEHATKGNVSGYHIFWCLDQPLDEKFSLTLWAKIASCVFLLATVVIYFYLGEVKSTFGKILINYSLAMICLMITLTVTHISRMPTRLDCKIRAYLLIFFNISAFAWVNVMSLDIWWTFGTPKRTIGSDQRKKDLKKFLLYFLYGWGMPLCHTLLILLFDSTRILPESIQPYLGMYKCFLENRNYSRTVLFLIPQLLFQIANTVLFVKTITYCIRVKNEISKMNDSTRNKENGKFSADKERFTLIVKLAVIMGIIWIFEVTTAFFDNMRSYSDFTKTLEIILDTVTCLQGVFIFLIFIFKKNTFNKLRNKLGLAKRKISCSMSVTQTSQVNGHYPMNKRQTTLSLNDSKI